MIPTLSPSLGPSLLLHRSVKSFTDCNARAFEDAVEKFIAVFVHGSAGGIKEAP